MAVHILKPAAPRLSPALDMQVFDADEEVDLSHQHVGSDTDFSMVTKLFADDAYLQAVALTAQLFAKFELTDVVLDKVDCSGARMHSAALLRVLIKDGRMTGVDFGGGTFEDCTFQNLKLDEAGFRMASFKKVCFENCILRGSQFSSARLQHVTFTDCDMENVVFDKATCSAVDLRGQFIGELKGVNGIAGATISDEQLIQLAPLLASELRLTIE